MFSQETARIACFIAFLYGSYWLCFRPRGGPWTTTYEICLTVGGAIGILLLGFPSRGNPETRSQQSQTNSSSPHDIAQGHPAKTEWRGDPDGKRRRLNIILIMFAVLGIGITIFLMAR